MKRGFLFAFFATIAGGARAQGQTATPNVEVGFDYPLVHATSASGGNQPTSTTGFTIQSISGETAWHKLLERGFKDLATGGASSYTMHQRGLYIGGMNVEPVAVITR
jgi:hypothetical protein